MRKIIVRFTAIVFIGLFGASVLNAGYVEADKIEMDLYVVKEQCKMVEKRLEEEKKKYFNHATINAYEKLSQKYQNKKVKIQKERDEIVGSLDSFNAKLKKLEGQISTISGPLHVEVDLERQEMFVYKGDTLVYFWRVSTAMNGYYTPTGTFRPYHTAAMHYSKQYDDAPMPYSVFFKDGFAIHGTNYVKSLGRRASHGCVRLHPSNANKLYNLVRANGYGNTTIKIK